MKTKHKALRKLTALALPAVVSVCAANMCCFSAYATDVSSDGLDASLSLSRGENNSIIADLSISNTNSFDIENIKLEAYGIEGYSLNEEWKLPDTIDVIRSGETASYSTEYFRNLNDTGGQTWGPTNGYGSKTRSSSGRSMVSKDNSYGASYRDGNALSARDKATKAAAEQNSQNSGGNSKDGSSGSNGTPSTGDSFPIKTLAAMAATSGAAMILCIRTKGGRKVLSMILVTAAFASAGTQFCSFRAIAEEETTQEQTEENTVTTTNEETTEEQTTTEENTTEPAESCFEEHSFEIETHKVMNNADNYFKVKITYNYPKPEMSGGEVLESYESMLDTDSGTYIIFTKQDKLSGSLKKYGELKSVSYTICDSEGNELMCGELEPSDTWTIDEPALVHGENTLTLQLEHTDGSSDSESISINNISEDTSEKDSLQDSDEDGIPDETEEKYGTDKEDPDTDGDGLSDIAEITVFGTDPLKKDSDDNDKNDNDEDMDNDGISNYDEVYVYFTDPASADSDGDGLSDHDEIHKYKTSPLKTDSDDDGASDKWEIDNNFAPDKKDESYGDLIPDKSDIRCENENVRIQDVFGDKMLNKKLNGYLGVKPFNIQLEETECAEISISLEKPELSENAVPALFFYDKEKSELSETDTTLVTEKDEDENIILKSADCELKQNGIYILLDKSEYSNVSREKILRKQEKGMPANSGIRILLLTDKNEKAVSMQTTEKYTGKLGNSKNAAFVKFSASVQLPEKIKE